MRALCRTASHRSLCVCNIKREHTQDGAGGRLAGRRAGATSYSRRKTHAEPEAHGGSGVHDGGGVGGHDGGRDGGHVVGEVGAGRCALALSANCVSI